jgi:multisubunit Na+/H+ antiporter MnhB subunit
MAPTMSAAQVAAFYRDPANLPRIRYSMILFNWFCVGLIPILILLVMQIRRMAHRTPILSYCMLACAAGGPAIFLIANLFWLLAAFRPERPPELTQLFNDLAWVTFTVEVPYLIMQSVLLALAIYWDRQDRPVFKRWVAHFNLLVAVALAPAAFTGLALGGPMAWNGLLPFWVKNIAIAVWIVVMGVVLDQAIRRQRVEDEVAA